MTTMPSSRLAMAPSLAALMQGASSQWLHIGDVDHRHLATLLLQDVDPLVAVARHRRRISRPVVADIFVHGGERAQLAVGALGHVADHIPFGHYVLSGRCRVYADLCCRHRPRKRTIQYSPTICGARCGTN